MVRVLAADPARPPRDIQDEVTLLRTITGIKRVYPAAHVPNHRPASHPPPTPPFAEWLLEHVEATVPTLVPTIHRYEFTGTPTSATAVRLFVLPDTADTPRLQEFAEHLRTTARITRRFAYVPRMLIAIRATPDEATLAEQLFHEQFR